MARQPGRPQGGVSTPVGRAPPGTPRTRTRPCRAGSPARAPPRGSRPRTAALRPAHTPRAGPRPCGSPWPPAQAIHQIPQTNMHPDNKPIMPSPDLSPSYSVPPSSRALIPPVRCACAWLGCGSRGGVHPHRLPGASGWRQGFLGGISGCQYRVPYLNLGLEDLHGAGVGELVLQVPACSR